MPWRSYDELAPRAQLMEDLDRVAQRPYGRAFTPSPGATPRLAKVVRARHGDRLTSGTLHDTLLRAVEALPLTNPPKATATYRELGYLLFLTVLPDDDLSRYDRDGGRRYSKIMALIEPSMRDIGTRDRRRIISRVRGRMADYLLAEPDQQPDDETPTAPSRTYISRPALEAAISDALENKNKPVVLWGPSGNGKSTLARHLTGLMPEHTVVVLHGPVIQGAEFEEDLNEALDRYGIRRESQLLGEKLRALANAPVAGSELNVIVLDNVTPESVDGASLAQGGAAILITSRERFPTAGHQPIRIGE